MSSQVDTLVREALAAPDESDERWERIRELHYLASREVFDACLDLMASEDPERREVGVDIVAQLGVSRETVTAGGTEVRLWEHPFPREAADALLELLGREHSPQVLDSIGAAFGHLHDERAVEPLAALRDHPDEDVRHSVVFGLLSHDNPTAIEALIDLSTDDDSDVRDWATFGLGSMTELDTVHIREALAARLDDPDQDTHDEAMVGLARRGDPRALHPFLTMIRDGWEGPIITETLLQLASRNGDGRLTPPLAELWDAKRRDPDFDPERYDDDELLIKALALHGLAADAGSAE